METDLLSSQEKSADLFRSKKIMQSSLTVNRNDEHETINEMTRGQILFIHSRIATTYVRMYVRTYVRTYIHWPFCISKTFASLSGVTRRKTTKKKPTTRTDLTGPSKTP